MKSLIDVRSAALLLAGVLLSACGGGVSTASGDSGDDGGGGVGLGGAQDIGAFRALLEAGQIPGENTLDANGFFSEHYSELPPADCGDPLCLVGMMAVGRDWVHRTDHAVLQVSLSTPLDPSELERSPLNLVVVVDRSGSMLEDNRIGFARQGLHTLIDELVEGDRLALVTYNDEVRVRSTLAEPSDPAALHAIVDELSADGGTNIHDGLQAGFELALAAFDPERQNRVLLISDGLATVGITDDFSIQSMAELYFSDGIGLTTIGVGLDFNVELMRGLAERGAGSFYFLEDASAIAEVFREELDTFVSPIALGVDLQIAAETGWRIGEVIGTRAWSGSDRSGSVTFPAVFMASRESDEPGEYGRRGAGGSIFVSMVTDEGRSVWDPSDAVAALRLRYRLPGTEEELETSLIVDSRPDAGASDREAYLSVEAMAEHYAMHNMYVGLREATRYAAYAYDCALTALERLDDKAATWQGEFADEDIDADREIIARFQANLRSLGARSVRSGFEDSCATYDGYDPYDDGSYEDDEVYVDDPLPYCQVGGHGSAGSWWFAGMALVLVIRGRVAARRRARG